MMKSVGIRYCGGCNSRYDRGAMVSRIIKNHPELKIEIAREENEYDCLLIIGGCSSCCASYGQFKTRRIVKISEDMNDIDFSAL